MIQPAELRIGNILYHHPFAHIFEVVEIKEIYTEELSHGKGTDGYIRNDIDEYLPILLTEEFFEKAGFNKENLSFTGLSGFVKRSKISYIGLNSENEKGWRLSNPHFDLVIQYVHQLQNLYFALAGEELSITHSADQMQKSH